MENSYQMMEKDKSFLGSGGGFPPEFSICRKSVGMLENEADIESSLHILLSTRPGERVMQPDYGCYLDELMFESLSTSLKTYVADLIETAVLFFEPRINLNRVDISETNENEGLFLIKLDYTVKATNSRYNYVYPLYKNEKTN